MVEYNEEQERQLVQSNSYSELNGKIYKSKLKYKFALSISIIVFLFIFLIVSLFSAAEVAYIKTYVVGVSMQPTLNYGYTSQASNENRDVVYINTYYKGNRGDIIVYHIYYSQDVQYVIKRIIAVGGDTLRIVVPDDINEPTQVYVNNELLVEDYIAEKHFEGFKFLSYDEEANKSNYPYLNPIGTPVDGQITIPQGYVFYMGDNRNHSDDCRGAYRTSSTSQEFRAGPRPANNIVGTVEYIVHVGQEDIESNTLLWAGVNAIFNYIGRSIFGIIG